MKNKTYSVYKHTCPNGKVYIGITSRSAEQRWNYGHGYDTQFFGKAVKKYGWGNIQHDVLLDGLTLEVACSWEQALIAQFKSNNPKYGYNADEGGKGCEGHKISEEARRKMSEHIKAAWERPEMREKLTKHLRELAKQNIGKPMSEERKQRIRETLSKPIVEYDLNGKEVERFPSIAEAGRQLSIGDGWIAQCCKGHPKRKTVRGRIFKYENEELTSEELKWRTTKEIPNKKSVVQMDTNGNVIQVFTSMHDADRSTGVSFKKISKACIKNTTAGGYVWRYKD